MRSIHASPSNTPRFADQRHCRSVPTISNAETLRQRCVGYLDSGRSAIGVSTLRAALRKLEYVERRNLVIDVSEANGKYALQRALAEDGRAES